jgi:adenylate cyclase
MGKLRSFFQRPCVVVTLGALIAFLVIFGLRRGGQLEFLELAAYDLFVRAAPKISSEDPRITVVEVTEADIQAIGHWPLSDAAIAQGVAILAAAKPRAIGVDIYRDIPVPPGTDAYNRMFRDNPRIIGIMTVGDKGIAPPAVIKDTPQAAFGDIVIDPGGVVRRGLLFLDDGTTTYTSLALSLATLYLEPEGISLQPDPLIPQHIKLGRTTIVPLEKNDGGYRKEDAGGYQFLVDFKSTGVPLRTYSYSDLLSGKIPGAAIEGRVILIGVNSQSVKDHFFTPLSRGGGEQLLSGIQLHGQITSQLLRFALDGAEPFKMPTETQKSIWMLFWGVAGAVIGFRTHSARRFALFIASGMLCLTGVDYLAFMQSWWLPLVPPGLSFFAAAGAVNAYKTGMEKKERAMLMQLFSKSVSKEIADMIWEQRDDFLDNGRPRSRKLTATIFFSDLRGFTSVSEKMDPQELIDWLNTYMESMAGLVLKHDGVIDNYIGDAIKADFGVPLPRKNEQEIRADAINAVTCALAMEKEMFRLNNVWGEKGLPAMGIRVGIFTGPVVAGLLGNSQRLKFTTIGDTVNTASRLESFDKEVGRDAVCRILIGSTTLDLLGSRFLTEKIGEASLKGKDEKITIHQVLGEKSSNTDIS